MKKLRVVFMGTPDFASAILDALFHWEGCEIVGVYTQPDRPAGRGKRMRISSVKQRAMELGLSVFQPLKFNNESDLLQLMSLKSDVICVAAYGLILPQRVLDIPRYAALNVHASLLPQYRGAAPIQRALMNGDDITGVTIMKMEANLDSGPIVLQQAIAVQPQDTAGDLFDILARHGSELLIGALRMAAENRLSFVPQNPDLVSYANKITTDDQIIDWTRTSYAIHNAIRALTPAPGARSTLVLPGRAPISVRIDPGMPVKEQVDHAPGVLFCYRDKELAVACGEGAYILRALRPAGKNTMRTSDFYNGWLKGNSSPYGIFECP